MTIDIGFLQQWIGKTEEIGDRLGAFQANALAATLDRDDPPYLDGMALPPLWHFVYCLTTTRMGGLGLDGHSARGGFLPPVPLPRRMWAGSRFTFNRSLRIGSDVRRVARVIGVEAKHGRTGPLVFITARFDMIDRDGVAQVEERDIVYREEKRADDVEPPPPPAPKDAVWRRVVIPDPVQLFRYSALTFNGHRIHYDPNFAVAQEGYPGIIVHGPLLATLLIDLLRRELPDAVLTSYQFRAVRPQFAPRPITICGAPSSDGRAVRLWAEDRDGGLAMEATARIAG